MPSIYGRSYNKELQDGDDCPPHPFSMAYGGNDDYEDPKDAWDFIGMSENQREHERQARKAFSKSTELMHIDYGKLDVPFKFVEIRCETEKAWCVLFDGDLWTWFPKSLCKIRGQHIIGPHSFMRKKAKDALENAGKPAPQGTRWQAPVQPIAIVVDTSPCPYCGKTDACDCASPGIVATRIPAPTEEMIAKLKLKNFIKENR